VARSDGLLPALLTLFLSTLRRTEWYAEEELALSSQWHKWRLVRISKDPYEELKTSVSNGSDMYIAGSNGHSLRQTLDLSELER
jgi:hypothetical protein